MNITLYTSVLLFVLVIPQVSALTFDSPRIVDDEGISVLKIDTNTIIHFQARLLEDDGIEQPYVFVRTVNDDHGNFVAESWITGALEIGETIHQSSVWIPEKPGNYQIILEIVDSLENRKLLTSPLFLTLEVEGEPVLTPLEELQLENEELKLQIQTLEAQILELQNQIDRLNEVLMEQLKIIYTWILER